MSGLRWRASHAAKCALRLGSSDSPRHRRPVQPGIPNRVGVYLVGAHLQVRRARLAIEVQRKIVGREDLAERHRCRVLVVGRHVAVVDPQVGQLAADEGAERVVADAGDQRGAIAQPGRGHRDVGGAAAQKLPERVDVLQPHTDLQGIDVDAAAPDGEDVKWLPSAQCQPSEGVGDSTRIDCARVTRRCQYFVLTFGHLNIRRKGGRPTAHSFGQQPPPRRLNHVRTTLTGQVLATLGCTARADAVGSPVLCRCRCGLISLRESNSQDVRRVAGQAAAVGPQQISGIASTDSAILNASRFNRLPSGPSGDSTANFEYRSMTASSGLAPLPANPGHTRRSPRHRLRLA